MEKLKSSITNMVLVLTGVAIGYLFASLVSLIKYIVHTDSLPDLVYWQMGSVANTRWYEVYSNKTRYESNKKR